MFPTERTPDYWLGKLTRLRPAQRSTPTGEVSFAPHKPLLLLALIDLAEIGKLPGQVVTRTPEMVLRFRALGTLVADRWPTRLDLRLPFYHLKSQGFWRALTSATTEASSPDSCTCIELDNNFAAALTNRDFRLKARLVLIDRYFTEPEQAGLFECLGLEIGRSRTTVNETVEAAIAAGRRKGRSARFQVRVVDDYHHTCALTGYRCFTSDGASIVDAAHIDSWAASQNDDLSNGLALSKSAHWMFDAGLWTVDDQLRVVVNQARFLEAGPEALQLRSMAGRHLQFDPQARLRPSLDSLRLHRLRFNRRG